MLPAVPSVSFTGSTNTSGNLTFTENESSGRTNVAHTSTGFAVPSRKTASGKISAKRIYNMQYNELTITELT